MDQTPATGSLSPFLNPEGWEVRFWHSGVSISSLRIGRKQKVCPQAWPLPPCYSETKADHVM